MQSDLPPAAAKAAPTRTVWSLRARLIALVLLATLPLAVLALLGYGWTVARSLGHRAEHDMLATADDCARRVEQWQHAFDDALLYVARHPDVRSGDSELQLTVLRHLANLPTSMDALMIVDAKGEATVRADDGPPVQFADRQWFKDAMAGRPIGHEALVSRRFGVPALATAVPIRDDRGHVRGVLVASLRMPDLSAMLQLPRLGRTGATFVVDEHGTLIAHSDQTFVADRLRTLRELLPSSPAEGRAPGDGTVARVTDAAGVEWLTGVEPMPNGWQVVTMQQRAEVFAAGRRQLVTAGVMAGLLMLLVVVLSFVAINRSLHPLKTIVAAADALAQGRWDVDADERVAPELVPVARAFNAARASLFEAYRTVELRVDQRTAELTESNRQLRQARAELQQSLARLEQTTREREFQQFALDQHAIIAVTDPAGTIQYVNDRFCQVSGYTREELLGSNHRMIQSGYHPRSFWVDMYTTLGRGDVWRGEVCNNTKAGEPYWLETTIVPFRDEAGKICRYVAMRTDVTLRKRMEQALAYSEQFARSTVDALTEHIAILDVNGTIIETNLAWKSQCERRAGGKPQYWVGFSYLDVCSDATGANPQDAAAICQGIDEVLKAQSRQFTYEYPTVVDGQPRWFLLRATRFQADDPVRVVTAHEDVTDRRLAEERLRYDSTHDPLTHLPNRTLLLDRITACRDRAAREPAYSFAVLFLDLDRFKVVNDSMGHTVGDQLLCGVAARLRQVVHAVALNHALGEQTTVARLGGDEFTILLDGPAAATAATDVAERILADLRRPIGVDGQDIYTSASLGIVCGTAHQTSALDVMRDADVAMYEAKTAGRGRFAMFDASMHARAVTRLRLENDLRHAIDRGEMLLHYQPIVSLTDRSLVGFEALVRWQRDGKLVSPADFIPVAEDTGLIVPIGAWVLTEACRQLATWRKLRPAAEHLSIAINLSRRQLSDPDLLPHLRAVLVETNLDPSLVKLEITESVIMDDADRAREVLTALKQTGVQLSMDDFGTGYSSLACLHRFPIDVLKIDRSFIWNSSGRRDVAAVVHSIIHLAHNLGMKVVAEGTETLDQVVFLQALDCDLAQGYYFAKPLDAPTAAKLIDTGFALSQTA